MYCDKIRWHSKKMRIHTISKLTVTLIFLAGFGVPPSLLAARQTTTPKTTTKPSVSPAGKKPSSNVKRRKPRQKVQTAPTPARVSEIQSALAAQGAYKAQPNGKWDTATIQAMKNYQSAHGLTATGKLDALTLQKLGLGSEIAGRAAPLPSNQPHAAPASGQQQTP